MDKNASNEPRNNILQQRLALVVISKDSYFLKGGGGGEGYWKARFCMHFKIYQEDAFPTLHIFNKYFSCHDLRVCFC